MSFYLELHKATQIRRDDSGMATSWRGGKLIKKFTMPLEFVDYVRANADKLKDAVAFTGSASLIVTANALIAADELKKVGVQK